MAFHVAVTTTNKIENYTTPGDVTGFSPDWCPVWVEIAGTESVAFGHGRAQHHQQSGGQRCAVRRSGLRGRHRLRAGLHRDRSIHHSLRASTRRGRGRCARRDWDPALSTVAGDRSTVPARPTVVGGHRRHPGDQGSPPRPRGRGSRRSSTDGGVLPPTGAPRRETHRRGCRRRSHAVARGSRRRRLGPPGGSLGRDRPGHHRCGGARVRNHWADGGWLDRRGRARGPPPSQSRRRHRTAIRRPAGRARSCEEPSRRPHELHPHLAELDRQGVGAPPPGVGYGRDGSAAHRQHGDEAGAGDRRRGRRDGARGPAAGAARRREPTSAARGARAGGRPALDPRSGRRPVLLIAEVENVGRSDAWAISWGITVWAGIRRAHRVAAGKAALFDFMFWIFVYIFMGLAPTAQIRADEVSSTTPGMDPLLDGRIAGAVVLGLFSYEVGRFAARHLVPALRSKQVSEGGPSPDLFGGPGRRPLDVVPSRAVVLTLVGVLAAAYYVYRIGVSTLFMSRYSAFEIRSERMPDIATRSIVSAAGSYPLLIAAGVYLRVWVTRALGERSGRHLPLLAVSVGALLLVVNPISAARYDFGTIVFALVVFAGAFGTLRRSRVTMAAVFTGFIFVFPIADAFRSNTLNTTRNGFFGEYLGNADYDGFWQIGNALSYADDGLVQPLRQALGVVLFWVPSAIWPDKPYDTGILLAQYRNYSFDNLSAPLWAELIVNGGLVLLVVGFVLVGVMLGRPPPTPAAAA